MANTSPAAWRLEEHWKRAAEIKPKLEEAYSPIEVPALKTVLPHGILRGRIFEVFGSRSSGRTSVSLRILGEATAKGEICAVVDLHDSFNPASAFASGVALEHIVWIRCGGNAAHAMRSVDLLLHAGGFGLIVLDLCEADSHTLNRIPLSYWHRFRRTIEQTPTVLLVCAHLAQAKSSASIHLKAKHQEAVWVGEEPFPLLHGCETYAISGKVLSIRPQSLTLEQKQS